MGMGRTITIERVDGLATMSMAGSRDTDEVLALEVELALDPVEHLTDDSGRPCGCGVGRLVSLLCRRCGLPLCAECMPSHVRFAHNVCPHGG